uniref:Cilia and flagella associated protein 70 n=1 Tax=Phasianus colchicus TaxID=9054 RepID=A0A669PN53_PHACC
MEQEMSFLKTGLNTAVICTSSPFLHIKSDTSITLVRVEYNGVILGDSSKADVSPNGTANYNFTASFEYSTDGPNSWVSIAQKPVLLTVIEVLQKEKKQKEEKTMPLGQAVLDLLPLLQGTTWTSTACVNASCSLALCFLNHFSPQCALEVSVCTRKPLLSASQLSDGNFLSVTLEAAYSVPEAFVPTGPSQNYMACLQVPAVGKKEVPLLFMNGILKLGGEKEPLPRPKKWSLANIMAPGALNIPNSFILGGPYEDEDGELNKAKDRKFRIQAESMKRIVWDTERRCYLDPAAVLILKKRIAECQYWPVEVCRMPVTSSSKGKTSKVDKGDEDRQIFFHGVAYVNMMPLLCPGVKRIRGAFRVFAYQDSEVLEKVRAGETARLRIELIQEPRNTAPVKLQPLSKEIPQCLSSQQYVEAGTFLVMEIKLDKALVPKRLQEELTKRVKEMIPPRPPLPPRTGGAKKAVEDYHKHIASIAVAILSEYHELFGKQPPDQGATDHQTLEEQKRQLNFELNSSGKYFAFKEQLKYAVVKIVREKYLKTTAFESQEQFQAFLSELYVYLVDQMHVALNQLLYEEAASPAPRIRMTDEQLWLFAREAEVNKDYKLASLYHQQVKEPLSLPYWLDYGAFCLLLEDTLKAQECFREALSLNPHHVRRCCVLPEGGKVMGVLHAADGELFLSPACCSVGSWQSCCSTMKRQRFSLRMLVAWINSCLSLPCHLYTVSLYTLCLLGAQPCSCFSLGLMEVRFLTDSSPVSGHREPLCTIFMKTVEFLMKFNAIQFVHMALAHELLIQQGGPSSAYYLALAQTCLLKEEFSKCEECLREAIKIDFLNPDVWAQKGHLCYLRRDLQEAKECYERTVKFVEDAADMHFVYLHLGSIYLEDKEYGKAKQIYLQACKSSASCLTWLGVGIACYRLEEMVEAEDALSEANALNNSNAEVWAYLALVCLQVSAQPAPQGSLKNTVSIPGLQMVGGAITAVLRWHKQRPSLLLISACWDLPEPTPSPFPFPFPRSLPLFPLPSLLCCVAGRAAAGGRAVLQICHKGECGHQTLLLPRVM